MDLPVRVGALNGLQPFDQAGFTGIDFLAATDEANDHCPVGMSIHNADQKLWLGHVEMITPAFPLHERSGLVQTPRALGLIEDDDLLNRCGCTTQRFIPKMMNILKESTHACL